MDRKEVRETLKVLYKYRQPSVEAAKELAEKLDTTPALVVETLEAVASDVIRAAFLDEALDEVAENLAEKLGMDPDELPEPKGEE